MIVTTEAVYIGTNEGTFKGKDGAEIHYRKAKFSVRDTADTFSVSVAQDCDISGLVPYEDASIDIDFRYQEKTGIWNGRLVAVHGSDGFGAF